MNRFLRPYLPIIEGFRELPRAMTDVVMLRPLRHAWRHDRPRFWATTVWAVWAEGTLLWWVWLWYR